MTFVGNWVELEKKSFQLWYSRLRKTIMVWICLYVDINYGTTEGRQSIKN